MWEQENRQSVFDGGGGERGLHQAFRLHSNNFYHHTPACVTSKLVPELFLISRGCVLDGLKLISS